MTITKNVPSDNVVFVRILTLLKEQNRTQKELIDHLGIHPNTFHHWKYQNSKGFLTRIDDIADYLNVTPGYLLKGNQLSADIDGLTPQEIQFIKSLRKLTDKQRKSLMQFVDNLV